MLHNVKKHFVAAHTDSGLLISCNHQHPSVATAVACISQPGGYVIAVKDNNFFALNEGEEAEFHAIMFGRTSRSKTTQQRFEFTFDKASA
jgi:hypothetical protein